MRSHAGDDTAVMSIECARCGDVHEATRADIMRGSWKDCPVCTPANITIMTPAQLIERHGDSGPEAA